MCQRWLRVTLLWVVVAVLTVLCAPPLAARETGADIGARERTRAQVRAPRTFFEWMLRGGILMIPITGCSVVSLAFVIERFLALRKRRIVAPTFFEDVSDLVRDGEIARAQALCRESRLPLAQLLHAILLCANGTRADMEAALENEGGRVVWDLRQNGKILGIVANIVTLLGLLGTVFGMISAFEGYAWQQGSPRPEVLAVGIYEALITTAAGLSIAIPSLFFYHYFRGKADALVREMEELGLELINIVLENRPPAPRGGGLR